MAEKLTWLKSIKRRSNLKRSNKRRARHAAVQQVPLHAQMLEDRRMLAFTVVDNSGVLDIDIVGSDNLQITTSGADLVISGAGGAKTTIAGGVASVTGLDIDGDGEISTIQSVTFSSALAGLADGVEIDAIDYLTVSASLAADSGIFEADVSANITMSAAVNAGSFNATAGNTFTGYGAFAVTTSVGDLEITTLKGALNASGHLTSAADLTLSAAPNSSLIAASMTAEGDIAIGGINFYQGPQYKISAGGEFNVSGIATTISIYGSLEANAVTGQGTGTFVYGNSAPLVVGDGGIHLETATGAINITQAIQTSGSVSLDANGFAVQTRSIETEGGDVYLAGLNYQNNAFNTIETNGGDVEMEFAQYIRLSDDILTSGGDLCITTTDLQAGGTNTDVLTDGGYATFQIKTATVGGYVDTSGGTLNITLTPTQANPAGVPFFVGKGDVVFPENSILAIDPSQVDLADTAPYSTFDIIRAFGGSVVDEGLQVLAIDFDKAGDDVTFAIDSIISSPAAGEVLRIVGTPSMAAVKDIVVDGPGNYKLVRDNKDTIDETDDWILLFRDCQLVAARPVELVGAVTVSGAENNDDSFTIEFSEGSPVVDGGVSFDGLGGDDEVILINGSPFRTTYDYEDTDGGKITVEGVVPYYLANGVFTYEGIEQITDNNKSVELFFNLPETDDTGTFRNTALGVEFVGATFANTNFRTPGHFMQVSGEGGDDTIAIGQGGEPDFVLPGIDFKVISPGDELKLNVDFQTQGGDFIVDVDYFKAISQKTFDLDTGLADINVTDTLFMTGNDPTRFFRAGMFEVTGGHIDFRNADLVATTGNVTITSPGGTLLVGDIDVLTSGETVLLNGDPIGILAGSITTNDGDITTTGGTFNFRGNARMNAGTGLVDMTHSAIMNMGGNTNRTHVAGKFTADTSIGMLDLGDANITVDDGIYLTSSKNVMVGLLTNKSSGKIEVVAGTDIFLPEGALGESGPIELTAFGTVVSGDLETKSASEPISITTDGAVSLQSVKTSDGDFTVVGNTGDDVESLKISETGLINTGLGNWQIEVAKAFEIEGLSVPQTHVGGNLTVLAGSLDAADSSFLASGQVSFAFDEDVLAVDITTTGFVSLLQVGTAGSLELNNLKAENGGVLVYATKNVQLGDVDTDKGIVSLGAFEGTLDVNNVTTNGAPVGIQAKLDITAADIDTSSSTGGNTKLQSTDGSITTNDIFTDDGNVNLIAAVDITVNDIYTSSGAVTPNAGGTFTFNVIDTSGSGGNVQIVSDYVDGGDIVTNGGKLTITSEFDVDLGDVHANTKTGTGKGVVVPGNETLRITSQKGTLTTGDVFADGSLTLKAGSTLGTSLTTQRIQTFGTTAPISIQTGGGVSLGMVSTFDGGLQVMGYSSGGAGAVSVLDIQTNGPTSIQSNDEVTTGSIAGNGILIDAKENLSTDGLKAIGAGSILLTSQKSILVTGNSSTEGGDFKAVAGPTLADNLTVQDVTTKGGNIYLEAGGTVTHGDLDADGGKIEILGNDIVFTGKFIKTGGGSFDYTSPGDFNILTIETEGGDVNLDIGGNLSFELIDTDGGIVNLLVVGNITGNGNIDTTGASGGHVTVEAGGSIDINNIDTMVGDVDLKAGTDLDFGDVATVGGKFKSDAGGATTGGNVVTKGSSAPVIVVASGDVTLGDVITGGESFTVVTPGNLSVGAVDTTDGGDLANAGDIDFSGVGGNLTLTGAFKSDDSFVYGSGADPKESLNAAGQDMTIYGYISIYVTGNVSVGNMTTLDNPTGDTSITIYSRDDVGAVSLGMLTTGSTSDDSSVKIWTGNGAVATGDIATGDSEQSDVDIDAYGGGISAGDITTGEASDGDSSVYLSTFDLESIGVDTTLQAGNVTTGDATEDAVARLFSYGALNVGNIATGSAFNTYAWFTANFYDMTTGDIFTGPAANNGRIALDVDEGDKITTGSLIGQYYSLIASEYEINGDLSGSVYSSIRFYVDTSSPPVMPLMTVSGQWTVAQNMDIAIFTGSGETTSIGGDYVLATADLIDVNDPLNDFDFYQNGAPAGAVDAVFAQDGSDMDSIIDELVVTLNNLP
ncbi:beta strand repeat-containing protein [Blastopirellula marina]|uniref:Uncharacterized protein n=1 Tax=Blastopirellula marina TaxID=124 RepID=A0A2S8GCB8_9BACT|nr:potassium channel protein [Blastopirellula marina]PQO42097.1 hypothetical protein C5Y93_27490 [Blastopirellula marina]